MSTAHVPEIESHDPYRLHEDGVYVPPFPGDHREDEYNSTGFETLLAMQRDHFWYRGRHRLLLDATRRHLAVMPPPRLVDLGGGCGGWVAYLCEHGYPAGELALGDSSETALRMAAPVLPVGVKRYQVDLLNLQWRGRWDGAYLLDVLEHIPDHAAALRQVREALAPGGVLIVTVPAFQTFWTWNDDQASHQRRYTKPGLAALARECGFQVREARYFLFFLSPLLLASRLITTPRVRRMTAEERFALSREMHGVPGPVINGVLSSVFDLERLLGRIVRFPWGTSLLAVLERDPGPDAPGPPQ